MRYIIKQPNNKYAIFSTIVDNFIAIDMTEESIIEFYTDEAIDKIRGEVKKSIQDLETKQIDSTSRIMNMDRALGVIKLCHGDEEMNKVKKQLKL